MDSLISIPVGIPASPAANCTVQSYLRPPDRFLCQRVPALPPCSVSGRLVQNNILQFRFKGGRCWKQKCMLLCFPHRRVNNRSSNSNSLCHKARSHEENQHRDHWNCRKSIYSYIAWCDAVVERWIWQNQRWFIRRRRLNTAKPSAYCAHLVVISYKYGTVLLLLLLLLLLHRYAR